MSLEIDKDESEECFEWRQPNEWEEENAKGLYVNSIMLTIIMWLIGFIFKKSLK